MPTRLIFVRHGESAHTAEGVVGGPRGCRGLTARGRDQAERVAARLAAEFGAEPVAVYSATLPRAIETAAAIAAALDTVPAQDCGLCTWHAPAWADGRPRADLRTRALPGGGAFTPFEEGSETWAEVVARCGRSIATIAARHAGGTAVLVGHTETVEVSFRALGQVPLHAPFDLRVGPASITEWGTDGDPAAWPPARWTLTRFSA